MDRLDIYKIDHSDLKKKEKLWHDRFFFVLTVAMVFFFHLLFERRRPSIFVIHFDGRQRYLFVHPH